MKFLPFEDWVKLQPDDDKMKVCQFCRGDKEQTCLTCGGEGDIDLMELNNAIDDGYEYETCRDCNGEGFINCSYCAGTGKDWRSKYSNEVSKAEATIKAWGTMAVQL